MSNIKFQFLGTCARDFSPKLQNELKDCFDKDARRSSCAMLEGHILIDCGIHAMECLRIAGISLSDISDVCVTHFHDDHYNEDHIRQIAAADRKQPLRLWVSDEADIPSFEGVMIIRMKKLEKNYMGDGMSITGLYANHDDNACPQHLLFEKDGKSILYATDGGWIDHRTYHALVKKNIDLIAIDATCGDYVGDMRLSDHNSIPMIRLMIPSFKTVGIMDDHTKMYMTHIAPSLHASHAETEKIAREMGIFTAYDGLCLEV